MYSRLFSMVNTKFKFLCRHSLYFERMQIYIFAKISLSLFLSRSISTIHTAIYYVSCAFCCCCFVSCKCVFDDDDEMMLKKKEDENEQK